MIIGRLEEWALRKAFVAASVCFLALQPDAWELVTFQGRHVLAPSFIGFVAVMVHDETFGATYKYTLGCIFGIFLAIAMTWICLAMLLSTASPYAALPLLFVCCFLYSYLEFKIPMGQKLGTSLLAMFLINYNLVDKTDITVPMVDTLYIVLDTVIGGVIATVGCMLPPPRLAGLDLEKQARFGASAMARIFEDLVVAWQHQKYYDNEADNVSISSGSVRTSGRWSASGKSGSDGGGGGESAFVPSLRSRGAAHGNTANGEDGESFVESDSTILAHPEATHKTPPSAHWRRLRLLIRGVAAFRAPLRARARASTAASQHHHTQYTRRRPQLAWLLSYRSQIRIDNFSLRAELQSFLREKTTLMKQRLGEAQWGPFHLKAAALYSPFIVLLQRLLMVAGMMEVRLKTMEKLIYRDGRAKQALHAFHRRPGFRAALRRFSCRLGHALVLLSQVFAAENSHLEDEFEAFLLLMEGELRALRRLQGDIDREYLAARKAVYYSSDEDTGMPHTLLPEVLVAMNSFLFFNQWAVSLLDCFVEDSRSLFYQKKESFVVWLCKTLCPPQSHLLFGVMEDDPGEDDPGEGVFGDKNNPPGEGCKQGQIKGVDINPSPPPPPAPAPAPAPAPVPEAETNYPPQTRKPRQRRRVKAHIKRRVQNSFTLATAMTMAGYYGLAAERQQPFMASFTIAYLSGGSVTGINLITSINRALGTVLACVYTLVVLMCYRGLESHSNASPDVFLAFAVVLFQIPCTYLRTRAVLSYAGTVASFSSILLLLAPLDSAHSIATDRIIDTFVGIVIFMTLELVMNPRSSENVVLEEIATTVEQVRSRFSHFIATFRDRDRDTGTGIGTGTGTGTGTVYKTSGSEPDFFAKRQLLLYNEAEPQSLLQVAKIPYGILEGALAGLEGCHNSISCLSMLAQSCSQDPRDPDGTKGTMEHLLAPLEQHLVKMDGIVGRACDRVVRNLGRLRDQGRVNAETVWRDRVGAPSSSSSSSSSSAGGRGSALAGGGDGGLDLHYQSLSAGSIKQLFESSDYRLGVLGLWGGQGTGTGTRDSLSDSAHARRTGTGTGTGTGGYGYGGDDADDGGGHLDELERGLEMLFSTFDGVVNGLQAKYSNGENAEAEAQAQAQPQPQGHGVSMSNDEVIAVNTYLSAIGDFVRSLHGLSLAVRQAQSYRVIRAGAGNKKHL